MKIEENESDEHGGSNEDIQNSVFYIAINYAQDKSSSEVP